jgi:hypothetical protein
MADLRAGRAANLALPAPPRRDTRHACEVRHSFSNEYRMEKVLPVAGGNYGFPFH